MATLEQIKTQRDKVSAAVDAWEVAAGQAASDATTAASAGAVAETAQQTADASQTIADERRATAAAEAQVLADLFAEEPVSRRKK